MKYLLDNIFGGMSRVKIALHSSLVALSFAAVTSCSEQGSTLVEFDNKLNTPNDTVNSLLGIISKLQIIADRTILLGEVRGELTAVTDEASLSIKNLANFESLNDNPYNQISDYYAVIQNCNYYLANADTTLMKRGQKVFEKEFAVVKAYRAWTYLQLAINYGSVPFFTQPLLTEKEADVNLYPKYDVKQIANYFIDDIAPYVDTDYPSYGSMNGLSSTKFYIPVRVLLGDLCLWAERYKESAQYYHDYLTKTGDIHPLEDNSCKFTDETFETISLGFRSSAASYTSALTVIPMEMRKYDGLMTNLENLFSSTSENNYYCSLTYSKAYQKLSAAQRYVLVHYDPVSLLPDTIEAGDKPEKMWADSRVTGDLRLYATYAVSSLASSSSNMSSIYQTCYKQYLSDVVLYRLPQVYLRYAEALNRAGYPNAAFAVLKYGLWKDNIEKYVPEDERAKAGTLLTFSEYTFTRDNTFGIHSRGCGNCEADIKYAIPALASKSDSILYVENLIGDEMALETAAEGTRYYDLMRLSMHRNDATYLAGKVANRMGYLDSDLYTKLSDQKNWYLPIK